MTQRTRHKGPSNRFFCNTNVLGINFQGQKQTFVLNIHSKFAKFNEYDNVSRLTINVTFYQRYISLPKELIQRSNFPYMLIESNLK